MPCSQVAKSSQKDLWKIGYDWITQKDEHGPHWDDGTNWAVAHHAIPKEADPTSIAIDDSGVSYGVVSAVLSCLGPHPWSTATAMWRSQVTITGMTGAQQLQWTIG